MGDTGPRQSRRRSRRQSKRQSRSKKLMVPESKKENRISSFGTDMKEQVTVSMELEVIHIENLVVPEYPIDVVVCVFYDEELIGITQGVSIANVEPHELNFVMEIKLNEPTLDDLFALMSKPVVVTLNTGKGLAGRPGIGGKVVTPRSHSQRESVTGKEKRASTVSKGSNSSRKSMKRKSSVKRKSLAKRQSTSRRVSVKIGQKTLSKTGSRTSTTGAPSTNVIGKGNIDLLPILQGESRIEEDIVMEVPEKLTGSDIRPYTSLPLVKIRLIDIDGITTILPPIENIAFFTVESMYNNVVPIGTHPNSHYYATIPLPLTPVEPNDLREFQLLHFENGFVEEYVDINFRKKWYSISNSPGRTCLTKYRINYKFDDVKDQDKIKVDFTKLPLAKEPRVNWNSLRRIWLTSKHESFLKETIIKYRVWPVEVSVSPSGPIDVSERLRFQENKPKLDETSTNSPRTPRTPKSITAETSSAGGGRRSMKGTRKSVAKRASKAPGGRKSVAKRASKAGGGSQKSAARKSNAGKRQSMKRQSNPGKRQSMKRQSKSGAGGGGRKSVTGKRPSRTGSVKEAKQNKAVADERERKPANPDIKHFIAYVDLSCLLFPGMKSTRAACQLYAYNQEEATMKWGLSESLMGYLVPPPGNSPPTYVLPPPPVGIASPITPVGLVNTTMTRQSTGVLPQYQGEMGNETEGEVEEKMIPEAVIHYDLPKLVPISTEDGRPVYIIVEVALLNPLVPKKTEEETIACLQDLLKLAKTTPQKDTFCKIAESHFENGMMTIIELLNKEYKDYQELRQSFVEPFLNYDEKQFYGHIENSGALAAIQETLKDIITKYAIDVVGAPEYGEKHPKELLNYISALYRRVVEDMYKVINMHDLDYQYNGYFEDLDEIGFPTQYDLLFFAAEAREQGQYEKSKYYLLKRIEGEENARSPDYWLDYAVNALRFGNISEALEATKEVLSLSIRHKEGLLVYAVLLTITGDLDGAELFFSALTDFHPLFLEGWVAWCIFYTLTGRSDAADTTLILAVRTMADLHPAFEDVKAPLLTWDEVPTSTNLFLRSAIYFLRYNLYEFAETCLAKELDRKHLRTWKFLYYLSVSHHLMERFSDSNRHLEEALRMHWENPLVWSLMGHNYYRLGDKDEAMKAYGFVLNEATREDDLHLIHLRMGYHYLDTDQPEEAKKCFLKTLTKHQTPAAWLGLGIACYTLDDIDDAELALIESNALDWTVALTWAYLAMVNLRKVNYDLFSQCVSQARKYGLDDEDLLKRIDAMRKEIECKEYEIVHKERSHGHSVFRHDLLSAYAESKQLPSVVISEQALPKPEDNSAEAESSLEPYQAEDLKGDGQAENEIDEVPTRDFEVSKDLEKSSRSSPGPKLCSQLTCEESTMISKFCVATHPKRRPDTKSKRLDVDYTYANKDLD